MTCIETSKISGIGACKVSKALCKGKKCLRLNHMINCRKARGMLKTEHPLFKYNNLHYIEYMFEARRLSL